jgi:hypothetical protein
MEALVVHPKCSPGRQMVVVVGMLAHHHHHHSFFFSFIQIKLGE